MIAKWNKWPRLDFWETLIYLGKICENEHSDNINGEMGQN